jgi:oligopeptidase A
MINPLIQPSQFFQFDLLQADQISPALDVLLQAAEAGVAQAIEQCQDYAAFTKALDVPLERLSKAWGVVGHINSVADTPEIRAAYNQNLGRITEFYTRLSSNEALYSRIKAIRQQEASTLLPEQIKVLDNSIRDFVLGGAELQGAARERYATIQARLAELSQAFSEHVMDATDAYKEYLPESDLAGVPLDIVAGLKQAALAEGNNQCLVRLHAPVYVPIMQYCQNREVRQRLHRAYNTRASELSDSQFDNTPLISAILELRIERARLLGYASPAELSLVTKMAPNPAHAIDFLRDFAHKSKAYATIDLQSLEAYAREHLGLDSIHTPDHAFVAEKLQEEKYCFNSQAVKQYFPESRVVSGLFKIIDEVFGISFVADNAPVWHPDVRFYRLECQGTTIAYCYMDLYARSGKRPGAWMDSLQSRWLRPDTQELQVPIAYLNCNFSGPTNGTEALFTHDEIITLFHETGHGLHHMLTKVQELNISGISGVEWDAVELPSQFMENFCWEWDVLKAMSCHQETGATLPRELFDKMLAAKNFLSAWQMVRQLEFGILDLVLHTDVSSPQKWAALVQQVRAEVAVVQYPEYNRFLQAFAHIFAGGYAAGYYSYKWAEVLSADCWAAFEEAQVQGRSWAMVGVDFRTHILEVGGSRPAMESFIAFRGRQPSVDALLRHNGLAGADTAL